MAHCRIGGSTRTHIGARGSPSSGALVVPSSLDDNALSPNTARRRYTLPADQQKPVLIPPPAANGATNGHAHTPSRPGSNPLQSFSTPLSFAPLPQPQPLPPPSPQPIRIGLDEFEKDYERLDHLGSGAFGNVYICKQRATGQAYVMKEILKRKFALSKWGAKLQNEYKVMLAVRHPHIVHAIEVFENDVLIQIVMEKADMDLDHYLISNSGTFVRKPDRILRCLFWQMLLAVKYLHDQNITHRDLKGENILLFESDARDLSYPYNAKLADFGVARWLDENGSAATLAGSVAYMAPEVLERSSYNAKVDMWSMGQILSRMYTGKVISKESLDQELSALSLTGTPLPEAVTDLMARLLVVDPDQRWSVDKALDHRWFTEDPNLAV